MLSCNQLKGNLNNLKYEVVKSSKKVNYVNLPCGFDIETTSITDQGQKVAFMYKWALGLGHDTPIYYGSTWQQFVEICDILQDHFNLNESNLLVIYVHNLAYEFQFMRKHFEFINVFALAERKPAKAITTQGIEFRCSYILSGSSLAVTAKNLVKHNVVKLVGDLDFNLIRHHKTELTPQEMGYLKNDIAVITAYIDEQLDIYKTLDKIPLTNTGRVRKYVRHACYYDNVNHKKSSKGKYLNYRRIMQDLTLDVPTYAMLKTAFMGGFTHANANYTNATLEQVSSIDFTSSYPAVMVAEKFPMSRFKNAEIKSLDELEKHCSKYAVVMNLRFENIRCKLKQETYISESKCSELTNPIINNGRVISADILTTTITEIDYKIMKQVYEWDSIKIGKVKYARKNYLPKAIIESILNLYQDKTKLKGVIGSEVEYLLSKGMLNSIYGMCVTDIVKDNAVYDEDTWAMLGVDVGTEIDGYNNSKNRFLFYAWGLWVTAYARFNLWTGIVAMGDDYIYSDTDSIKLLNYEKHSKYISWFNANIIKKMQGTCNYYKLDENLLNPKTKEGVSKMLGIWDYEGTYQKFKTLGSKRYMQLEKGGISITIAGLSKVNGSKYILELANGDVDKAFSLFDDGLYVPAQKTGKMTHTYLDEPFKLNVKDHLGVSATVETLSGVHLENCDFTLSISKQYAGFLESLGDGKLYKGLNFND